ncbi:MAG: GNAT family N-acetyltransferase [Actinobacteria bacterium]|nr:GNAT family N-acetyltransferase [Actinomycetota bacterium]
MTVADFDMPYPQYHCPSCGKDLPLGEARMTVMCAEHFFGDKLDFAVREALPADRAAIEEICDRALGEVEVDAFGRTYDVTQGANLIAEVDGKLGGLLSMAIDRGELVIVLLSVYPEHQGRSLGSALLNAAISFASARSLPIVRVAVSNDDIPLLYFYQRNGFTIYDIAVGRLIDESGTSVAGFSGILSRDEIHLRRPVCDKR